MDLTWTIPDIVLRLGAATGAGMIVGLNRDLTNKPIGMRTPALVAPRDSFAPIRWDVGPASFLPLLASVEHNRRGVEPLPFVAHDLGSNADPAGSDGILTRCIF